MYFIIVKQTCMYTMYIYRFYSIHIVISNRLGLQSLTALYIKSVSFFNNV